MVIFSITLNLVFADVFFEPVKISAASYFVVPIDWSAFTASYPTDPNATLQKNLLRNANKFAVTTWYDTVKNFDAQTQTYLDFGGIGENNIRPSACEAFSLAVSIRLGIYDPTYTGVSLTDARNKAVKMARSLAYRHKVNLSGGWGDAWQSTYWAGMAGASGWLLWEYLGSTDQQNVRQMVEYEANRYNTYATPYWKDRAGNIIYSGDSKAEENAWNALGVNVACAMMPNHQNYPIWSRKALELCISSYAKPDDITSSTVVNGMRLSNWLNGSNANNDSSVVNHGIIHPAYAAAILQNLFAPAVYTLAKKQTPQGCLFNADKTYDALVDLNFSSPPYASPGGTSYIDGSYAIYYPQGNDWGTGNYNCYNVYDAISDAYRLDTLASQPGSYWEDLHGNKVAAQQARSSDGRTYIDGTEDTYANREEKIAYEVATACLSKWAALQDEFGLTNAPPPSVNLMEGENAVALSNSNGGVYVYSDLGATGGLAMGSINNVGDGVAFQSLNAGSSLTFRYCTSSNGQLSLYLNGVYSQKVSFTSTGGYSGSYAYKTVTTNIPQDANIKLQFDSGDSIGNNLDYIAINQTTVNDDSPSVQYGGTWTDNNSASGRINGDEHYTKIVNSYAQYIFTGTAIKWIGIKNTNRGKANVYLDGVLDATVDCYGSLSKQRELYTKTGLAGGSHTIKIVCTGQKNASATDCYLDVDGFLYQ